MKTYFYGKKEKSNFKAKNASIDVISKEKIVDGGGMASLLEHVIEIIILSVEVSNHDNGFLHLHQVGLGL